MSFKKQITCLLLMFGLTISAGFGQQISVQIIDARSKDPVIGAHIMSAKHDVFAVSDLKGFFEIDTVAVEFPIMIHALGYQMLLIASLEEDHPIWLTPTTIQFDQEIVINGGSEHQHNVNTYQHQSSDISMDDFLATVDGLSMIQRGAFAWEPAIRGQSDQRLNVMIDGMAVFKACVDKMDPITSYVEVNNLASLKVDKNGASVAQNGNGYASINMRTEKAAFGASQLEFESNYKAPNNMYLFRLNTSSSNTKNSLSYRLSGSYRKADQLVAGNNTTIENTQFEKWNLNLSVLSKVNDRLQIETNYITDKAYDVGYPALLMDASSAYADILRVQVNIKENDAAFSIHNVAAYANLIRHTMDDYNRNVSERVVMRDMNMPMYGETTTFGFNSEGRLNLKNRSFNWYLNGYQSSSFGDMEMISTSPNIADMYIYNLNDVVMNNISVGLSHNWLLSDRANLSLEQNLQFASVSTSNASNVEFFEGLYQREISERIQVLPSVSTSLLYMLSNDWSLSNTFVYSARTGNHIEQYGHYIYNYVDGFFYNGNPWLKNEHAFNGEVAVSVERDAFSASLSLFSRFYLNYIDGMLLDDQSAQGLEFKQYANVGDAVFTGGELRVLQRVNSTLSFDHRLAYVYAQNTTLDEPIPLIPPLNGSSLMNARFGDVFTSFTLEWAAKQQRIATQSSIEDQTNGYAVLHASIGKSWSNERITTSLNFRNLTDRYYHTHTSIGNIPSEGFSVMFGFTYQL
ncbi:MAG: hypothetical protein NXI08_07545 [bacterium]|nr:hypothetical protein [bacterium]